MKYTIDGEPLVQIKLDPERISGKSVGFGFREPGQPATCVLQSGFILATGTKEAASVFFWWGEGYSSTSPKHIRLWQYQVDRLMRAPPGLPYEYCCMT